MTIKRVLRKIFIICLAGREKIHKTNTIIDLEHYEGKYLFSWREEPQFTHELHKVELMNIAQ